MNHFRLNLFPVIVTCFYLLFINNACEQNPIDPVDNSQNKKEVNLGAWYFGGWSFPPDNDGYTFHISPTLVNQFPEREPIWGWREDDPEIMKWQIDYAADAGLSFWGFCWYENTLVSNPELMDNLNNALDLFLHAPNREKLDFLLLSCHPVSSVNWEKLCDKTISYFMEPNYLKIDGKPVMIFFNTEEVIEGMGGLEGAREALKLYREKAAMAGIDTIMIGARVAPDVVYSSFGEKYRFCGFDFVTTYSQSDFGRINSGPNDYSALIDADKRTWELLPKNSNMPYIPTLSTGYDMRPWAADHPTLPASDYWYTGVTPDRIENHLWDAIDWIRVNENKVLGNLLIIYAWNEYGEGAWLTPTKANGNERLNAIKHVIHEMNTNLDD